MILPGFTGSSPVSVLIERNVARSSITLGSVYKTGITPTFDRFGKYVCEVPLSVPTRSCVYTSRIPLECSHALSNTDIVLGMDWISTCCAILSDDALVLEDPGLSAIAALPAGHYWTGNDGMFITIPFSSQLKIGFPRRTEV